MNYEAHEATDLKQDITGEIPQPAEGPELPPDSADCPPRLERTEGEAEDAQPPRLGRSMIYRPEPSETGGSGKKAKGLGEVSLGETVEHYCKRHQLDNAIKNNNKIAIHNTARDLAKLEAKEASKK